MTTKSKLEPLLWLDSNRGVYIPQHFAEGFSNSRDAVHGVANEDWHTVLAGPAAEWYWEAWDNFTDSAVVTLDGNRYRVWQDGDCCDCWLIPDGMEWSDENDWFVWPSQGNGDAAL